MSGADRAQPGAPPEPSVDTGWAELIGRAQSGDAEAAEAARALLEAFINGNRRRPLADYIARCLGRYLRGGVPIELALHLNRITPPVVRGASGEGDRRRAARSPRAAPDGSGSGGRELERPHRVRELQARGRGGRQSTSDKAAAEKRKRSRASRRRRAAMPSASDPD